MKNTPLISLFLPSYVKNLAQIPFSIRLFQHKKCPSVVRLFVRPLSVCRQNRVQIAPVATHFQWYKKAFGSVWFHPFHPVHLNTRKSPQNRPFTAIPRAKYNLCKPRLNFCYRKRAPRPSKIKPKYKFWYSLFCTGVPAKFSITHCFSGNFRAKLCQIILYGLFWAP